MSGKKQSSYLRVKTKQGVSYGGDQQWLPYRYLKKSGCGVIGAADLILCLQGKTFVTQEEYLKLTEELRKNYLPVIPFLGMNGITLMTGLNRYFRKHQMPYQAYWCFSGKKILQRIDRMLSQNIPVIASAGPNIPRFWKKEGLKLYQCDQEGRHYPVTKARAHFLIFTAREKTWLRTSSWGKEYDVDLTEYQEYAAHVSCPWVSNMIEIKKKSRK